MLRLIGIKAGERFSASAGATRGTVVVDATALSPEATGAALAATGKTAVLSSAAASDNAVFVFVHKGDAGTFHGFGRAVESSPCFCTEQSRPGRCAECGWTNASHPIDERGYLRDAPLPAHRRSARPVDLSLGNDEIRWRAESSSGGDEIVAAVIVLKPWGKEVNVLTSGYKGRRDWRVTTFYADGRVETATLDAWRAARITPEAL